MRPYNYTYKSDNHNTRHSKNQLRSRLKSKVKRKLNQKKQIPTSSGTKPYGSKQKKLNLSNEITNFYSINKQKIWKTKSEKINLTTEFNIFDNPERVIGTILDILYKATTNQEYVTLDYKSGVCFGALYFIDTICWEIARSKKWVLNLQHLPMAEREMLLNLKSFRTSCSDNQYTYIVHSKIKINRTDDKLAKQEFKLKSTEIRELIGRGLSESNNNRVELTIDQHHALDSAISEHFDNILLHAPNATYGFLCGMYNKHDKSVSILIYNYGPTIADTLNNEELPEEVKTFKDTVIGNHISKNYFEFKRHFNKENALTLLAIQEGISSVIGVDKSRGHGIIDFIGHCFELSKETKITFISGNTAIRIDKKYMISSREIMNRSRKMLALNEENDIFTKPDSNYVKNIRFKFPGVIIVTHIPLVN